MTENPLTDQGVASLLRARKDGAALLHLVHLGLEGTRTSAVAQRDSAVIGVVKPHRLLIVGVNQGSR